MLTTYTLSKFPEISFDDMLEAKRHIESEFGGLKRVLKCSPEAYIAIKDLCVDEEQERLLHKYILAENRKKKGLEPYAEPPNYWGSIFGIEIKLDPDLKPGQWRFE